LWKGWGDRRGVEAMEEGKGEVFVEGKGEVLVEGKKEGIVEGNGVEVLLKGREG